VSSNIKAQASSFGKKDKLEPLMPEKGSIPKRIKKFQMGAGLEAFRTEFRQDQKTAGSRKRTKPLGYFQAISQMEGYSRKFNRSYISPGTRKHDNWVPNTYSFIFFGNF
jgi:hypothetical protein